MADNTGEISPSPASLIYTTVGMNRELRQAEIISGVIQYVYDPVRKLNQPVEHDFAISATPDCDLLQEFNKRDAGKASDLNTILFYEVQIAAAAKASIGGTDLWKRVKNNKDERYHVLQAVPDNFDLLGIGLAAMFVDFKKSFSLTPHQIYNQIGSGVTLKRRCRLEMPYREHFTSRAAFFFQRVMLPEQHELD